MKKIILASIIAGLAALHVSAGQTAFKNTDIVGTWDSKGCETFVVGAETAFIKRNFVFTNSTWQLKYTVFADPACNVGLFSNKIVGSYTFGEAINANTLKVTWGQSAKFITAHVPDIQAVLNQTGCGDTTLPLNTERDVSLTGCMAFGIATVKDYSQEYDILKLEKNQLFTGLRVENMNLEKNRPTQIFEFPLIKR